MKKNIIFILLIAVLFLYIIALPLAYYFYYYSDHPIKNNKVVALLAKDSQKVVRWLHDVPYFVYKFKSDDLPTYELYIDNKYLLDLNKGLPKDKAGVLEMGPEDNKPAKFVANNKEYKVKVRYRGDHSNQWIGQKKSLRIIFEDPEGFRGMKKMNLIVPDARGYFVESFNKYKAKKLGLAAPFDDFVKLKINNRFYGIYYLTEHWEKEFLKRNNLDPLSDLYGELNLWDPIFEDTKYWKNFINDMDGNNDSYKALENFLNLVSFSEDREFKNQISEVLDMDKFYVWWFHSLLSGGVHQDLSHNIRLYFDKDTKKFQFIPTDVSGGSIDENIMDRYYNPVMGRVLKFPEFVQQRNMVLWSFVKDKSFLEEDLKFYDNLWKRTKVAFYNDPFKIDISVDIDALYVGYRKKVVNNFYNLRKQLQQSKVTTDIYKNLSSKSNELSYQLIPLAIDFTTKNYSAVNLKKITILSLLSNNTGDLFVYADSNKDGFLDKSDKQIGKIVYNRTNNSYNSIKINQLLHTELKPPHELFKLYKLEPTKYRFFFISSSNMKVDSVNIKFEMENNVTGDKTENKINYL